MKEVVITTPTVPRSFDSIKDLITTHTEIAINTKLFSGCVIGIIRNDKEAILPFGSYTYESGATQMHENSVFDVASITKSVPTSSLALWLISQGRLKLDDPLKKFIPEFEGTYSDDVIIQHLLTFTMELNISLDILNLNPYSIVGDDILEKVLKAGLAEKPGSNFQYRNTTSILLGIVIERITGKKLDVLAEEIFFRPLGMNKTMFDPLARIPRSEIVPTEICAWRDKLIQGEVHDEMTSLFGGKAVGSSGLFSTVPDLLRFAKMIMSRGSFNAGNFFSQRILETFKENYLKDIGREYTLGWDKLSWGYIGCPCFCRTAIVITGFTGCSMMVDIRKCIAIIILSNAIHPKRDPGSMYEFRRTIADIMVYCKHCYE